MITLLELVICIKNLSVTVFVQSCIHISIIRKTLVQFLGWWTFFSTDSIQDLLNTSSHDKFFRGFQKLLHVGLFVLFIYAFPWLITL